MHTIPSILKTLKSRFQSSANNEFSNRPFFLLQSIPQSTVTFWDTCVLNFSSLTSLFLPRGPWHVSYDDLLTSLSSGRTTVTTPLLGSTRSRSVPLRPNMTGPPSGSEPLSVYTAAPTGVLSLTTCRFMSAVNDGGRLAVTPGRQTNNMFLVVTK